MKKNLLTLILSVLCLTVAGQGNQTGSTLLGDANGDGIISEADVEAVAKFIIGDSSANIIFKNADINHDDIVNVVDLVGLIGILNSSVPTSHISPAYVGLDWDDVTLGLCDPDNGVFKLTYQQHDPQLKKGSVTIVNNGDVQYVILITGVEKENKTYTLQAEVGDLSYIFSNTEFTLSTDSDDANDNSLQNLYLDESGAKASTRSFTDGLTIGDGKIRKTGNLWSNGDQERTDNLFDDNNVKAYTKSKLGINLDYVATLKFGERVETEKDGIKFYCAKDYTVDVCLKGDVDAYFDFYIDVEKEEQDIDLSPNEDCKYVLLKHKLFPDLKLKFTVGPVPICIDLGTDLFADVSLKGSGEFHFTQGIGATSETVIGGRYDGKSEDKFEMYHIRKPLTITPHDPTISGKASVSGKVHVFPRIHAWLYGLIGPSIDIKPYVKADLSGGFKKDLIQDAASDFCALSLNTYGGLDVAAGLSSSRMNYEEWNKSTEDHNVREDILYQSPIAVRFLSAEPNSIESGVTTTVKFEVYDKGFDNNNVLTPLPQLVKFDGKGTVTSDYGKFGVANSGVVTASWTPTSSDDILYARLYDVDGNIIAEAMYGDSARVVETRIIEVTDITYNSATVKASSTFNSLILGIKKATDDNFVEYWIDKNENGEFSKTFNDMYHLEIDTEYQCYVSSVYAGGGTASSDTISFRTKHICPDNNHPHMIDLGLGVKWSCCNIDAEKPYEYGGYYAWGEISPRPIPTYYNEAYAYYNEENGGNLFIGDDISATQYDVARYKWGGLWRMPTVQEFNKLCEQCPSTWAEMNGIKGHLFVSSINGNAIFLPAAGSTSGNKWDGGNLGGEGNSGEYWSSTYCTSEAGWTEFSYCLDFLWATPDTGGTSETTYKCRFCAQSVRAVTN